MKKSSSILLYLATILLLCQSCKTAGTADPKLTRIIETCSGKISGTPGEHDGVTVYKGIPYAAPPLDSLRWRKPQPVEPWDSIRVCDRFADACIQPGSAEGTFYWKEFYEGDSTRQSEDCLYLNVWAPDTMPTNKMPVAVWIHGGAYINGYGHEKEFDGNAYVKRGVILVTINYRLGIFGFIAHPDLTAENNGIGSGNYGLFDQLAAIQWVKDNIQAFGGDPDNITVMGQSAGAGSVMALISSPLTDGLISKAIIQSGRGLGGLSPTPLEIAEEVTTSHLAQSGIESIDSLRTLSPQQLSSILQGVATRPCIDGQLVTTSFENIASEARELDIPYMVGFTSEDIDPAAMCRGAIDWSLMLEAQHRDPAFVYCFSRDLPGEDMEGDNLKGAFGDMKGAFHSSELWYMFGTLDRSWRPMTDADHRLSDLMLDYWTNFIKSGNPNADGLPAWHPCTAADPFILNLDID